MRKEIDASRCSGPEQILILVLGGEGVALQDILRLLTLWFKYGEAAEVDDAEARELLREVLGDGRRPVGLLVAVDGDALLDLLVLLVAELHLHGLDVDGALEVARDGLGGADHKAVGTRAE